VIEVGERYSPQFQFQVVLEVLKGDREAVEIARVYDLHPTTIARWKREFSAKGPEVFSKDGTVAQYEKKIKEMERVLGRREVEIALLRSFMDDSS